ncbi:hypothetical protein D3C75_1037140 [compost metagenome]
MRFPHNLLAVDQNRPVQHDHGQRMPFLHLQGGGMPGVQLHIPHVDRAEGTRWASMTTVVPGNHPDLPGVIRQRHDRNILVEQSLVTRRRHFVFGWQVDP